MIRTLLMLQLVLSATTALAQGTPTTITVRAISRDAKVLGDGVGGARITIRDTVTGKVLASGLQRGGTGDTRRIMQEPRARGAVVYGTEGAASFRATLLLDKPTHVEIVAEGPLKYPQAMQRVSKMMLLIPGGHIEGEGVLLEIHGFIVDIISPAAAPAGPPLDVRAKVTMSCGCPTEPGGLWDADRISITARAIQRGKVMGETHLRYAGETSTFEGALPSLKAGVYELEVLASDDNSGNFGRATRRLVVPRGGR